MYFGEIKPIVVSSVVDFSGDEEFNIKRRRKGGVDHDIDGGSSH